jgi:hypothetical protein
MRADGSEKSTSMIKAFAVEIVDDAECQASVLTCRSASFNVPASRVTSAN